MRFFTIVFIILGFSGSFLIAEETKNWKLNASSMMRSEFDGTDFNNDTPIGNFTLMRTRVQYAHQFDRWSTFVQIQDARILGNDPSNITRGNNIDLFQGYVKVEDIFGLMDLQLGRFQLSYGSQRFLGALGWNWVGRTFDGGRLFIKRDKFSIDLFGVTLRENANFKGRANSAQYPDTLGNFWLTGFWSTYNINKNHRLDLFGYADLDRNKTLDPDEANLSRMTFGTSYYGKIGGLNLTFEGAYQLGNRMIDKGGEGGSNIVQEDISAYLASLTATYQISDFKIGAAADIISGDNDGTDDVLNAFTTSYGTNHKYYGHMDYFLELNSHTQGYGLNDIYLILAFKFSATNNLNCNIHYLTTNADDGVSNGVYGQEIDIFYNYIARPGLKFTFGFSYLNTDERFNQQFNAGVANEVDNPLWGYIMMNAAM